MTADTELRSMSVTVKKANFGIKLPGIRTGILGQVASNIEASGDCDVPLSVEMPNQHRWIKRVGEKGCKC